MSAYGLQVRASGGTNQLDPSASQEGFAHELGHFLGRRGIIDGKAEDNNHARSGDAGITSWQKGKVRLVTDDLIPMLKGALGLGKSKRIDLKAPE